MVDDSVVSHACIFILKAAGSFSKESILRIFQSIKGINMVLPPVIKH